MQVDAYVFVYEVLTSLLLLTLIPIVPKCVYLFIKSSTWVLAGDWNALLVLNNFDDDTTDTVGTGVRNNDPEFITTFTHTLQPMLVTSTIETKVQPRPVLQNGSIYPSSNDFEEAVETAVDTAHQGSYVYAEDGNAFTQKPGPCGTRG